MDNATPLQIIHFDGTGFDPTSSINYFPIFDYNINNKLNKYEIKKICLFLIAPGWVRT